jgi:enolase
MAGPARHRRGSAPPRAAVGAGRRRGWARPDVAVHRAGLSLLVEGIEQAGLTPGEDAAIAIDVAATQFYEPATGRYRLALEDREVSSADWIGELVGWCAEFPIASLEDPLADQDWKSWPKAAADLAGIQLLGDDLFVTDSARLARGIEDGVANAVLVKPNQTGTLSDAARVVEQAKAARFATVLSARSGETEDTWLADLAVGWQTRQIKVGSTMRAERTAKWNRLLRIEAELGDKATFAGTSGLAPRFGN